MPALNQACCLKELDPKLDLGADIQQEVIVAGGAAEGTVLFLLYSYSTVFFAS